MVRTVARSRVEKWPDSGATISTRGCAVAISFLKWSSVPNGVTCAASSRTSTSRLPTVTRVDAEWRAGMGQAGAGDQLIDRGEVAHRRMVGEQRRAAGIGHHARPGPDRHHDVGVHLICDVQHPAVHGRRGPSDDGGPRPLTQAGKLVHFLLHCDKNMNILCS